MPKKSSKKPSKRTSKRTSKRPSKKMSKSNSKKRNYINQKINEVILYNMIKEADNFNESDTRVFEILKGYKTVYEFIVQKGLEYQIDVNNYNMSTGISSVDYYLKMPYTGPYTTNMHIVGYLNMHTFVWNKYMRKQHYYDYLSTVAPYVKNNQSLLTLEKLFSYDHITFSERYKYVIPYFLSYMYDPKKANILRYIDATGFEIFIYIELSLDIPYWYQMTDFIIDEMNKPSYYGGSNNKITGINNKLTGTNKKLSNDIRTIRDDVRGYQSKIFNKKIAKKIDEFNKNFDNLKE